MSELTPCNFCSLEAIKQRHKGHKVEVKPGTGEWKGWTVVSVDGEPVSWMWKLPTHCVC